MSDHGGWETLIESVYGSFVEREAVRSTERQVMPLACSSWIGHPVLVQARTFEWKPKHNDQQILAP
jgi:hypothetical protein